jgi:ribosomal protein S18 acetylase RimI-like enzyme
MESEIMIRKILKKDRNDYFAMSKSFYTSKALIEPKDPKHLESTFVQLIASNPLLEGYVYEINGKVASYMLLTFSYSNELGGEMITIDELYIKPEYQRRGIASKMIEFVEKQFPHHRAISLLVNMDNKQAKAVYMHKGFRPVDYMPMIKMNLS